MNTRLFQGITLALLVLASAPDVQGQDDRRGAYQLTLGPERGTATSANQSINSTGVDVRLQLAPAPLGSETMRVGIFAGIEGGYAKLSGRYYQGFGDSTRMFTRWELGPAITYHKNNTDVSLYAYAMIWSDNDYVDATVGANNFYMLKASVRQGRFLGEVAQSLKANINTNGTLTDAAVWLLGRRFSVGLRYQQRHAINDDKVQFLSLAFGIIE